MNKLPDVLAHHEVLHDVASGPVGIAVQDVRHGRSRLRPVGIGEESAHVGRRHPLADLQPPMIWRIYIGQW